MKRKLIAIILSIVVLSGIITLSVYAAPKTTTPKATATANKDKPAVNKLTDAEKAKLKELKPQLKAIKDKIMALRVELKTAKQAKDKAKVATIKAEMKKQILALKAIRDANKSLFDKIKGNRELRREFRLKKFGQ